MGKEVVNVNDLAELYRIVSKIRNLKNKIYLKIIRGKKVDEKLIRMLKDYLVLLKRRKNSGFNYEISQLEKDIIYLEKGREGLFNYFKKKYNGFEKEVEDSVEKLKMKRFSILLSDRDGTINNHSEIYRLSIQPVFSAVFLNKFIEKCVEKAIILSSGPLKDMMELNILRNKKLIYAGSKGLEFYSNKGLKKYKIDKNKEKSLLKLASDIRNLLKEERYKKFGLIGSGFQIKVGQLAVAKQNISKVISEKESNEFLRGIKGLVDKNGKKNFILRDTGLDIEIMISNNGRDYDKKDGAEFVLGNLKNENLLVCGDSETDLAMLRLNKVAPLFVANEKLKRKLGKKAICVSNPDVLVSILERYSEVCENEV